MPETVLVLSVAPNATMPKPLMSGSLKVFIATGSKAMVVVVAPSVVYTPRLESLARVPMKATVPVALTLGEAKLLNTPPLLSTTGAGGAAADEDGLVESAVDVAGRGKVDPPIGRKRRCAEPAEVDLVGREEWK